MLEVKDGKVVKEAKSYGCRSLNREVIASLRMKKRDGNIAICKVLDHTMYHDHSQPTSNFVSSLILEDAGTSLEIWIESQWFFDPIFVFLHPLLDALKFLNNIRLRRCTPREHMCGSRRKKKLEGQVGQFRMQLGMGMVYFI